MSGLRTVTLAGPGLESAQSGATGSSGTAEPAKGTSGPPAIGAMLLLAMALALAWLIRRRSPTQNGDE